jgi:predicted pyridoxine 5'-phosphate oxidase superfamily flavin-nucleotide-binding protein
MLFCTQDDIFHENIQLNPDIGCLFIDLSTRRRFRINGYVSREGTQFITIAIKEAYPNCPKYIQRRATLLSDSLDQKGTTISYGKELGADERESISNADTFFVGTMNEDGRLDASHRGGKAGFVQTLSNTVLKIPDYQGNSFYNTLGNIACNPFAGLLFIDFENGSTLQLTGKAELLFDQRSIFDLKNTGGTGRYWLFETSAWIHTKNHHQLKWEFKDHSPFNP